MLVKGVPGEKHVSRSHILVVHIYLDVYILYIPNLDLHVFAPNVNYHDLLPSTTFGIFAADSAECDID